MYGRTVALVVHIHEPLNSHPSTWKYSLTFVPSSRSWSHQYKPASSAIRKYLGYFTILSPGHFLRQATRSAAAPDQDRGQKDNRQKQKKQPAFLSRLNLDNRLAPSATTLSSRPNNIYSYLDCNVLNTGHLFVTSLLTAWVLRFQE